jgi:hypothetical protein
MNHNELLSKLGACEGGSSFASNYSNPKDAWFECVRSDWMFWLLEKLHIEIPTDCICDIAETAVQFAGEDEITTCVWAIDARRRLAHGEGSQEEVDAAGAAARAAWDAAWAAGAAGAAAGAARDAVTWDTGTAGAATRAAWDAAENAAWAAARAAARATWDTGTAGAAAGAAGAAGAAAGAEHCRIIRQHISWHKVSKALKGI